MTTPRFLIFAQHTLLNTARSGVQRVVIETAKALQARAPIDFVKWDRLDGQLRYFDRRDLAKLFGETTTAGNVVPHPACHRARYRFGDVIENTDTTWLLFPEIPYHQQQGNEIFARILSQCREYGVRVAAIFYDLIPIRGPAYEEFRRPHIEYVLELLRADLIFPISRFSAEDLLAYFETDVGLSDSMLHDLRERVDAVPLGERGVRTGVSAATDASRAERPPVIVMVGAIEPRKQQTRFLKVFNDLRRDLPQLDRYEIRLFGSLHPASAEALSRELKRNPQIQYRGYAPDAEVEAAWAEAAFSVFVSRSEGYGLPIAESLGHGVPCLTSNFGAMAEVAVGGGCHTVDALSDQAIAEGLITMATNEARLAELGSEISRRSVRTWDDYATEIIEHCRCSDSRRAIDVSAARQTVSHALERQKGRYEAQRIGPMCWRFATVEDAADMHATEGSRPRAERGSGETGVCAVVGTAGNGISEIPNDSLRMMVDADVLGISDQDTLEALVTRAEQAAVPKLLPSRIVIGREPDRLWVALADAICDVTREVASAQETARREAMLGASAQRLIRCREVDEPALTIVVSTYNRGPFVEKNVEWLLSLVKRLPRLVKVIVVDNASTDDTMTRLERFVGQAQFGYLRNPTNVGMLGNLQVCSAQLASRYVWITGDDDFVMPEAMERVIEVIASHPRIPLLVHNFGVYYRERLAADDSPKRFMAEMHRLAPQASPSGVRRVNDIAGEHDNLFTAIYPLVFRSDVLAACFNYPFEGVPFMDLVESVPSTKLILERLRYCDAYWFKEEGIVGNAHNSWARHRPRWHLVLMARVFDLARSAGVADAKLAKWAKVHVPLFEEAITIARERQVPVNLDLPADLENAFRIYRSRLSVGPEVFISAGSDKPVWKRNAAP